MRWHFLLSLAMVLAMAAAGEVNSIEDLDLENLLKSEAQTRAAFDCLLDKGPCGDLQKLRDSIPQMVETKCANCTPKQKEKYDQVNKLISTKYPEEFQAVVQKYSSKSE